MHKFKKTFAIALALSLSLSLPLTSFADKPDSVGYHKEQRDDRKSSKWNDHSKYKLEDRLDEDKIEEIKEKIKLLEIKLELTEEENNVDAFANMTDEEALVELNELKSELSGLFDTKETRKHEMKNLRKGLRSLIKAGYTEAELMDLLNLKLKFESEYENITVLDVDSVISRHGGFKFDTPPVIKEGRTLIPVSAIVNGFGADVLWSAKDKTVTITKDDTIIVITIGSNIALVNKIEVEMGTRANIMNNRTIVPMRFIAETLHLKVKWNEDDRTIEIDDTNTTLKVEGNGFSLVGTQIFVPISTTTLELDAALEAVEDGSYTIEDGSNNVIGTDATEVQSSNVVVSLAEDGYTEEIYTIIYADDSTTLTEAEDGFAIEGSIVTIPENTTLEELTAVLAFPVGASFVLNNISDELISEDEYVILTEDKISVTAQDGTIGTYTIEYASVDTEMAITGDEFSLTDLAITVPFGTTVSELDAALTTTSGAFILKDLDGADLEDGTLVNTDVVVTIAEDDATEVTYSIVITPAPASTDVSLTTETDGIVISEDVALEEYTITIASGILTSQLNEALIAATNGSFILKDLNGTEIVSEDAILVNTDVVVSIAEDVATYRTYEISIIME